MTRSVQKANFRRPGRKLRRMSPLIVITAGILFVLLTLAVFAPSISPFDIRAQSLLNRLQPPAFLGGSPDHVLGTDQLGRDVLSRLLHALRTTLGIATVGTFIGMSVGVLLGLLAGMFRGYLEDAVMFLVDVQMSLPFILIALTAVAIWGTNLNVLIAVLGLAGWDVYARVVRGQVLAVREQPYVEASGALGSSTFRTVFKHVLPNVMSPIIVLATTNFSFLVLLESSLSFIGLGVQPPATSLGAMLGSARDYLITAWPLAAVPAVVIVSITVCVSLLGDWLRDTLDPGLKKR